MSPITNFISGFIIIVIIIIISTRITIIAIMDVTVAYPPLLFSFICIIHMPVIITNTTLNININITMASLITSITTLDKPSATIHHPARAAYRYCYPRHQHQHQHHQYYARINTIRIGITITIIIPSINAMVVVINTSHLNNHIRIATLSHMGNLQSRTWVDTCQVMYG